MKRYSKFIGAFLYLVVQVVNCLAPTGGWKGPLAVTISALTALVVYLVPNAPAAPPGAHATNLAQYPPFPKAGGTA